MAQLQGFDRLQKKLREKRDSAGNMRVSVVVGYTQNYAIYVHENLQAHHPIGQAKFLEQPFRQLASSGEITRIVIAALDNNRTLEEGLLLAGLRIQRDSQQLVPIDTGALKNSAFTEVDKTP